MARKHFIMARDGARRGCLAGPFNSAAEAEANFTRVRHLAAIVDSRAFHYELDIASFPESSDYLPDPVVTDTHLRVA